MDPASCATLCRDGCYDQLDEGEQERILLGLVERARFHRTYIGAIERGEKNLTLDSFERIAKALKVTPFVLFQEAELEG